MIFEITESVGADDYKKLGEIITELKASGYQFAMDDYGTFGVKRAKVVEDVKKLMTHILTHLFAYKIAHLRHP